MEINSIWFTQWQTMTCHDMNYGKTSSIQKLRMLDQITKLEVANEKGLKLLNAFCFATDGEQSWTEIEIDGKHRIFKKQSKMMLCVNPTYPTKGGKYRETDVSQAIRLAQEKEVLND